MKRYTCESCHEVGYGWEISAPAELPASRVEEIVKALIDCTDTPDQDDLAWVLLDDFGDAEDLELLRRIRINVDCVHRDTFSQSFVEKGGDT